MNNKELMRCAACAELKSIEAFPVVGKHLSPPFATAVGTSYVCADCLAKSLGRKGHRLEDVDHLCQWLDLPFDADKWIATEDENTSLTTRILDYAACVSAGSYRTDLGDTWATSNAIWEKCREYGTVLDELKSLAPDLLIYLRKKWGNVDGFCLEDYMRMEEYERHTLNHYPFKDEARRDMVRKLAKLSAVADQMLSLGQTREATAVLQSYNTLMRELGIKTETASDDNTIESLSELVAYLEKTGFLLNYRVNENRDIVDATITNIQQYNKRLFTDAAETAHEMYDSYAIQQNSGTAITDDDIEALYEHDASEDVLADARAMSDEELEKMFQDIAAGGK